MILRLNNIQFVRKAKGHMPSSTSRLGLERPSHKYIKRENLGNGKYKYIYEDAKGKSAPSSKDTEALAQDFASSISMDKVFMKYAGYFDTKDYVNVAGAIMARGEDATPEAFMTEMQYASQALGTKVSKFLPTGVAAKEYKKLWTLAGNRTTEYNAKIAKVQSKLNSQRGE